MAPFYMCTIYIKRDSVTMLSFLTKHHSTSFHPKYLYVRACSYMYEVLYIGFLLSISEIYYTLDYAYIMTPFYF